MTYRCLLVSVLLLLIPLAGCAMADVKVSEGVHADSGDIDCPNVCSDTYPVGHTVVFTQTEASYWGGCWWSYDFKGEAKVYDEEREEDADGNPILRLKLIDDVTIGMGCLPDSPDPDL